MADTHDILTKLIILAKKGLSVAEIHIAIQTAEKQIDTELQEARRIFNENYLKLSDNMTTQLQQQQERVEKLEGAVKIILGEFSFKSDLGTCLVCAPSPEHNRHLDKCPAENLKVAFKELEAE